MTDHATTALLHYQLPQMPDVVVRSFMVSNTPSPPGAINVNDVVLLFSLSLNTSEWWVIVTMTTSCVRVCGSEM